MKNSERIFAAANEVIPNGVSSPMRTFSLVGGSPIILESAKGSKIIDVDGREYTDFLSGFGAIYLGHSRTEISNAVSEQLDKGLVVGLSTEIEQQLAKKIVDSTSAIDKLRFVVSGSEAVMTALRIARAYTNRKLFLKFVGSYHGHADALLAQPEGNEGVATKGTTNGVAEHNVLLCEYNNSEQLREIFETHGDQIAAVIVEPFATNMGFVKPQQGFHQNIRQLCNDYGSLFIFDEVVTGFRFRFGGVSELLDVDPDLTTFGKIIGGGAPVGAYGGKEKFMKLVEIGNKVFQSGTFAGNPITMSAGNAALDIMAQPGFYEKMDAKGKLLESEIKTHFAKFDIPFHFTRFGALSGIAFRRSEADMKSYSDVKQQEYDVFKNTHLVMREKGYLMAPSLEEPIFLTDAHSEEDIKGFAKALAETIAEQLQKHF
ncbi:MULTISPECIES: aspartate aminotransferase family protein [Pseudoalteromonas]|uniref:aspartate aminotransferase family protein n=1 Tax=Pseudoalteromonas TaxID=53246 RepID=UPI001107ED2A|nr:MULTISPECIES: glutamate-1-semialdehyde 2,1-aminomutase [Pseudoalteromonas]MCG9760808.1 glutamate-1-semialdehyde 2,1-aminomutase [Pseudoalteromonas sp. Isolate6]NKC17339.1 aminotransferase class III-fold pyridoxal phosphate-dependent enzyme [Pseudoalteromonas galatheae]